MSHNETEKEGKIGNDISRACHGGVSNNVSLCVACVAFSEG